MTAKNDKRPVGRPRNHPMPERIDASPEQIADVFMRAKPKREWRYVREAAKTDERGG